MTASVLGEVVRHVPAEERVLLPPLFAWLRATRRVRDDTLVVPEVRWLGRRVDLVTLTVSGVLSAYELKLAHITRALEQAVYNRAAFDRSFVVTASTPKPRALGHARDNGIGILLVREGRCILLTASPRIRSDASLRQRVVRLVQHAGTGHV